MGERERMKRTLWVEPLESRQLLSLTPLDASFGAEGVAQVFATGNANDQLSAMTVQLDGKIVAVGKTDSGTAGAWKSAVARYNIDGTLDSTFGTLGRATFTNTVSLEGVLQLPDGKLLVAGRTTAGQLTILRLTSAGAVEAAVATPTISSTITGMALAHGERYVMGNSGASATVVRLLLDGQTEKSFGTNGVVTLPADFSANTAPLLLPDGKMLVAGSKSVTTPAGATNDFALLRLNFDGTLDSGFGTGGIVTTEIDYNGVNQSNRAYAMTSDGQGRILLAGSWRGDGTAAVVRYEPDGTLDSTFGDAGIQRLGQIPAPKAILLRSDGSIMLATQVIPSLAAMHLSADGQPDMTYGGGDGVASTTVGSLPVYLSGAIVSDSRLILGTTARLGTTSNDVALLAFDDVGLLDPTLAGSGQVMTDFGSYAYPGARAMATASDGRILVAGGTGQGDRSTLMRFWPDGRLDTTFGNDGRAVHPAITSERLRSILGVIVTATDRIIALGYRDTGFGAVSYLPSGQIDTTWGTLGVASLPTGPTEIDSDRFLSAVLLGDKLVVAGGNTVVRRNANGSADTTFGSGGTLTMSSPFNRITGLAVQDGKLLVAGEMVVGRLNDNGSLDTAFGAGGWRGLPSTVSARCLTVAGGRILVGGAKGNLAAVTALTAQGAIDTAFGTAGVATAQIGAYSTVRAMVVEPDGAILAASAVSPQFGPRPTQVGLCAFGPAGTLLTAFGTGGVVLSNAIQEVYSAMPAGPGRILVAGKAGNAITLAQFINSAVHPVATIAAPSPGATDPAISEIPVSFNLPVTGVDIADFELTRNGGGNLLGAGHTLVAVDEKNFILQGLASATRPAGVYTLRLRSAASGILGPGDSPLACDELARWSVQPTLSIVGTTAVSTFTIVRDGPDLVIQQSDPPTTYRVDFASLREWKLTTGRFSGIDGSDPAASVVLDLSAGPVVPPLGAIILQGYTGDTLAITPGTGTTAFLRNIRQLSGYITQNPTRLTLPDQLLFTDAQNFRFGAGQYVEATDLYERDATLDPGANLVLQTWNRPLGLFLNGDSSVRLELDAVLNTDRLTMSEDALIDLAGRTMEVTYQFNEVLDASRLDAIAQRIAAARNVAGGPLWSGKGITSSLARENPSLFGVGAKIVSSSDWAVVKATLHGDINLDSIVDIDDYFTLDCAYALGLSGGWHTGDFDYSGGPPDSDDYFLADLGFISQGTAPLAAIPAPQPLSPPAPNPLFAEQPDAPGDDVLGIGDSQ